MSQTRQLPTFILPAWPLKVFDFMPLARGQFCLRWTRPDVRHLACCMGSLTPGVSKEAMWRTCVVKHNVEHTFKISVGGRKESTDRKKRKKKERGGYHSTSSLFWARKLGKRGVFREKDFFLILWPIFILSIFPSARNGLNKTWNLLIGHPSGLFIPQPTFGCVLWD